MGRQGLAFCIVLAVWFCTSAAGQISPGPLSKFHEQLEGVTRCGSCHDFGAGSRGFKCLACHAEIRHRVEAHTGYHAHEYKPSASEADCARCHMEHNGQGFEIKRLDKNNFDHLAETGFALEGKHRKQACEKCHTVKNIAASVRSEIKLKDHNRSFLGLRRECASCHEDVHRGQLGADCAHCHNNFEAFKPAPGFNHANARYQLTGLHEKVTCQKCHGPRNGEKTIQYKGLNFTGCQGCHNDPHRGGFQEVKFQGSCDTCHNTNGWKNNHPSATFHHETTKFPLNGKHAEVVCAKCHKTADFHQPIKHERCGDCHEDTHKGQFTSRAAGSDCGSCHTETGYKPTKFDLDTHRLAAFPLEGKHSELKCSDCHEPEGKDAVYLMRKVTCPACHADRHAEEFKAEPIANQCDRCHTQASFQPTIFTVELHSKTQFALTGGHVKVVCADCHKPLTAAIVALPAPNASDAVFIRSLRQYHFATRTCITCHTDPHQIPVTSKATCETCHTVEKWQEVKFDHSTTKFELKGSHKEVKCIDCHKPPSPPVVTVTAKPAPGGAAAKPVPGFSTTQNRCFECHASKDPHGGQFRTAEREQDCDSCHAAVKWKEGVFEHEKTRYPLDRVHIVVACDKCHKLQKQADGKSIRIYRGTTSECVQCH